MTTKALRELAEALVDLQDVIARPAGSFPKPEPDQPPAFPELEHYPPVDAENARAALGLRLRYLEARFEQSNRQWKTIPLEMRRRIIAESWLIRFERVVAEFKKAATLLKESRDED